jgi:carboxypeptidase Q
MHRPWALILASLTACAGPSTTHATPSSDPAGSLRALAGGALIEPQGASMLRVLSVDIGPRIPGTEACTRAESYVADRMRAIGMTNVHLEEVQLPDRWEPGDVALELVSPEAHALKPIQMMWTGPAESSVVTLRRVSVDGPLEPSVRGQLLVTERGPLSGNMSIRFRKVVDFFQRAQAAGARGVVLLGKGKNPLSVSVVDPSRPAALMPMPVVLLGGEDSETLERLLAKGTTKARFMARPRLPGPGVAHNVVGEVAGRAPGEVVVIGAHLDSVAGSPGAFDDGAGVVTTLEVARLIRAAGPTRRTLRVVAFTGEELGMVGSKAYVRQHRAELGPVVAMVQIDGVAQVWTDWMVFGRKDVQAGLQRALSPLGTASGTPRLESLGPLFLAFSDHAPFALEGIPTTFAFKREAVLGPDPKIHTPEDAFDGISSALLASSTATHTVLLHHLLDSEAPLAPRLGPDEVRAWVAREHFEPDAWMMDRGDLLGAR